MLDDFADWVAKFTSAKLDRLRAGNDRTRELLRRSNGLIAKSEDLLKAEVPKVWHPGPP
jgi:hypothetical protein